MSKETTVVRKGGFTFKKPGKSLSLSKPKVASNFASNPLPFECTTVKPSQPSTLQPSRQQSGDQDGVSILSQTFNKPPQDDGIQRKNIAVKSKKTVQTSIMDFAKQSGTKPVAAVAPHWSPPKSEPREQCDSRKRKSGEMTSNNWHMSNLSSMFATFVDDDDDIDDFDQDVIQGSPPFRKTAASDKKTPQRNVNIIADSDGEEDEIVHKSKRRKTMSVLDSDDEEEEEETGTDITVHSDSINTKLSVENNISTSKQALPVTPVPVKHLERTNRTSDVPEIPKDMELLDLQHQLLTVTDKICDLLMGVSMTDLMSLMKKKYQHLQKLLQNRLEIKEKDPNILQPVHRYIAFQPNSTGQCDSVMPRAQGCRDLSSRPGQNLNSPCQNSQLRGISNGKAVSPLSCSFQGKTSGNIQLPSTSTVKKAVAPLPPSDQRLGSPIPCGDSFFESDAVLTQSHQSFMSSFKRHSLPGGTCSSNDSSVCASPVLPLLAKRQQASPLFDSVSKQRNQDVNKSRNCVLSDIQTERNSSGPGTSISAAVNKQIYNNFNSDSPEFDSVDEQMNLEMAESTDYEFDYKISSHSKPAVSVATRAPVIQNENSTDMFDITDFDEEFAEEVSADENVLPAIAHTSRSPGQQSNAFRRYSHTEDTSTAEEDEDEVNPQHKEYASYSFPHCREMMKVFNTVFGLQKFRKHQLEACNAALLGNDCFILMPTGGGKSLCYQLPALVSGGVSIIVSPLRALIQDQVQKLQSLGIPAGHLSSDVSQTEADLLYKKLYKRVPEITLLYVTPEKISASGKLLSVMDNLYSRKLLDRFVIDEAHCVSSWGHDFRPDYKKLCILREKFPGVPIMALTATATMRVRKDILHQLKMNDPKWFTQSFNRQNLKMQVIAKKPSTATKDIIKMIKEDFPGKCGIVYCLSRKECDDTASALIKAGILAVSYHAGLNDGERTMIQERWLNGNRCKVICATIAFGMGIDKPDVRFVIHYSLPKSVEGYYQEAGRAGRDGLLSHCYLMYTYQDVKRLRRIIEMDQSVTYESKRVHIDNLFRMIQYCENVYDCRRAQLLHYFGEHKFDRSTCGQFRGSICDNCLSKETFKLRDVTEDAKEIVKCVRSLTTGRRNDYTLIHLVEIFKGSKSSKIVEQGHDKLPLHGRGTLYSRQDADRLFRKLVIDGVLMEELKITAMEHTACYIKLGRKSGDVLSGKMKVELQVQENRKKAAVAKIGREPVSQKQTLIDECYNELVDLAKTLAAEHQVVNYSNVFRTNSLRHMAEVMPVTVDGLRTIEGMTEKIISKYNPGRFLEVTTKYSAMVASLADISAVPEEEGTPEEWSSHYFNSDVGDSSQRKTNGRKKFFAKRKRGGAARGGGSRGGVRKKAPAQEKNASSNGWMSKSRGNFSQYSYKSKSTAGQKKTATSSSTGFSRGGGSSLGFMPVPQPKRSFLQSGGSFMG